MEVMISVNPPYTSMIFSGHKLYEFRNSVLKGMDADYPTENIKAYIYETKNKGGKGAVIGEVTIAGAFSPNYGKQEESTTELVLERFYCIKTLYLYWCEINAVMPNMNEGWFKSKKFHDYQIEIGFYDKKNKLSFNYALVLDSPIEYDEAIPLELFNGASGKRLSKPPQNMFYVSQRREVYEIDNR